jgi:hypothetical protein
VVAVPAQRLDREGWQGKDGAAGRGFQRPNGEFPAPAAVTTSADALASDSLGEDGGVDDGEGLAEPDGAGVQV